MQSFEMAGELENFVGNLAFPCVGAKTALSKKQIDLYEAGSLHSTEHDKTILKRLRSYLELCERDHSLFRSFIVCFPETRELTEEEFEIGLWQRLASLHELDDSAWDPSVSSDIDDPKFSFSLAGKAFYIVGMHPGSSRKARRFPVPAIVFNLHEQFERLREDGSYSRMREIIRRRDKLFSGSVNPMLDDFGRRSEALQYSGRHVESVEFRCPFHERSFHA